MLSANDYTMDHKGDGDSSKVLEDHDGWESNEYSQMHNRFVTLI